ncbi:MAG: hypothetical protein ACI4A5_10625 [Hominilimicola sp.]
MTEITVPPIYVCSTQEKKNIKDSFIIENQPYSLFILCTSGKGSIITEQMHEQSISEKMLIYIGPTIFTAIRVLSDDFSLRFIGFGGVAVPGLLEYSGMDMSYVIENIPKKVLSQFNAIFKTRMYDEARQSVKISGKVDISDFLIQYGISKTTLNNILKQGINGTIQFCRIEEIKQILITRPLDNLEILRKYCGFDSVDEMAA